MKAYIYKRWIPYMETFVNAQLLYVHVDMEACIYGSHAYTKNSSAYRKFDFYICVCISMCKCKNYIYTNAIFHVCDYVYLYQYARKYIEVNLHKCTCISTYVWLSYMHCFHIYMFIQKFHIYISHLLHMHNFFIFI